MDTLNVTLHRISGNKVIARTRHVMTRLHAVNLTRLRTFAPKSSYGEIFFISRLELVDKVLNPKMKKKNGGHRLCFGENGSGKMP